jgi:hypothetical protein
MSSSPWLRNGALIGCTVACVLTRAPAQAGPVEQLVDVAFGSGDTPVIVARYANGGGGLIYSADRKRWRLQCASAFLAPDETLNGPPLILANGTLLLATSAGVVAGQLDGCDLHREFSPEGGRVVDLVADPTEPDAAFALVTTQDSASTSLRRRSPSGTWSAFGASAAGSATSLRVATGGGQLRIYETALLAAQDDDAGRRYYTQKLRYSDDGAVSFHEFPLPGGGTPRIIGIDPANPDHVAVLVDRSSAADNILISRDRGSALTPYLQVEEYGGFAWATDGRIWIGESSTGAGTGGGLWAAPNLDSAPARLAMADYTVQCLSYHEASSGLYACQHFWLGQVDPGSGAFATLLSFTGVDAFVSCDGSSTAASCEMQLCGAYCGAGHFAVAPVCAAYDKPGCGVSVAREESGAAAQPAATGRPDAGAATKKRVVASDGGQPMRAAGSAPTRESCAVDRVHAARPNPPWSLLACALILRGLRSPGRRARTVERRSQALEQVSSCGLGTACSRRHSCSSASATSNSAALRAG